MGGLDSEFWWHLFIILGSLSLMLFVVNIILRKYLGVQRKKFFSYNHVNEKHKKIERIIRGSFIVLFIIATTINILFWEASLWYLTPHILLIPFIIALEVTRAVMEKKYADNQNDYKFTLAQLGFILIVLLVMDIYFYYYAFSNELPVT
ncbi:DUF4181 domain-containing protein [Bacillus sp. SCS-153A]|uniref:DUF4181 domain-containing protein n=1 Tax=Rossellomorea sedimentorum TaxID=3115294 RepID=UPI003906B09C